MLRSHERLTRRAPLLQFPHTADVVFVQETWKTKGGETAMKVYGMTEADLQTCASAVGVTLYELRQVGNAQQFTLRPDRSTKNSNGDHRYQRTSAHFMHDERRVFAVCWHGHRDFMREVFRINPNAKITTERLGDICYDGEEDFEQKFPDTAYIEVGAPIAPRHAHEICKCEE